MVAPPSTAMVWPRDIRRSVRSKKDSDAFQFAGLPDAAHRDALDHRRLHPLESFFRHTGGKEARRDAVHADAGGRPFGSQFPGQRDQTALGGNVAGRVDVSGHGTQAGHGRNVEDHPGTPAQHFAPGSLRAEERPGEVGIQNGAPPFQRHIFSGGAPGDTGVIDQDVDLSEMLEGLLRPPRPRIPGRQRRTRRTRSGRRLPAGDRR